MIGRSFLAAVAGAVAMFLWTFIAHMALSLGETGVKELPNEQLVLSTLQTNLEAGGFYIFPGTGLAANATREEKRAAMKKASEDYEKKSSGVLIYHPPGRPFAFGKWLGTEFATELLEVFLATALLAQTRLVAFGARVWFMTVAGILAATATNVSYWNWYGFPTSYTLAYMTTEIVGFFCAALVVATVLNRTVFGKPVIL